MHVTAPPNVESTRHHVFNREWRAKCGYSDIGALGGAKKTDSAFPLVIKDDGSLQHNIHSGIKDTVFWGVGYIQVFRAILKALREF